MKKRFIFALILLIVACGEASETAVSSTIPDPDTTYFQDVSRAAGITQTRQSNDRAIGQAWGDFNQDGWIDFYVTDTRGPNSLFQNNGDGTFARPAFAETVALPDGYSGGASFADFNNDGWPDLYVVNWGENHLFRNDAGLGFNDVTAEAGVGGDANSQTASWGDYNNDGRLDLYVTNWSCYPRCGRPSQGDADRLYHNNGDGTFTDVTQLLGGKTIGSGFVASFTDYDNDGDLDIYLVNDVFIHSLSNMLWRNDGPGCDGWCFTEVAAEAGADIKLFGMGLATTDYDNDGDIDFYFSNAGPMVLLQNQGDGTFVDVAVEAGVDMADHIAWGTAALDYNNDGWEDLYLAVMSTAGHDKLSTNPLFHNNGDGTFTRIRSGSGAGDVGPTMGVATADFDNDGWVDLLLGNKDNGYSLLRNQTGDLTDNHWFSLALVGDGPVNRDAVGSRVTVQTADGTVQVREVQNGSSLGAGNSLTLHFGLGTAVAIDTLTIRWPDGRVQAFTDVPASRTVTLPYPLNAAAEAAQQAALYPVADSPSPFLTIGRLVWALHLLVWPLLLIIAIRYRHSLKRYRRAMLGAGVGIVGVITAVFLFTGGANLNFSLPRQTEPTLSQRMAAAGATLPVQLPVASEAEVELGRALFWDPVLSGNQDISCATCHHPDEGSGDSLALSIGTGGKGLGLNRVLLPEARQVLVPRNATPIYNLGLEGMDVLFWDGRVSVLPDGQFDSPANDDLPAGLTNVIAAQAMFPITSRDEMRGHRGEIDIFGERNPLASVADHQFPLMWETLMSRLMAIPAYQEMFQAAYPDIPLAEMGFEQAANAMAAYQMTIFTFLDSPWDDYLRGDETAVSADVLAGAELFYGAAGCAECHSGPLLTDLQFHNIGVPQVGPGKGNEEPYDFGRARETGNEADLFAFRTPPLRNVAITPPYMHNGAYATLEAAVLHHLNPQLAMAQYDFTQLHPLVLVEDSGDTAVHTAALNAPSFNLPPTDLSDEELRVLLAFLEALTSPSATDLSHIVPEAVPSGLPVGGSID